MPIRKRAGSRPPKPSAKSKKRSPHPQQATAHAIGSEDSSLREHLLYLLRGGGAHLDFEKAIAGLPTELRGAKPSGLPFSAWALLEHMRIAQWDILEFSRDPEAHLTGVARWLLAGDRCSTEHRGLGPKRRSLPCRPEGDGAACRQRQDGPAC